MAEEIQEAVQIIRVAYDGIEIAMKVGSGGIAAMQKAIDFLKGMLDYEKSLGKTSMRKLLLKGGDLQVLQFKTEDMSRSFWARGQLIKNQAVRQRADREAHQEIMMF